MEEKIDQKIDAVQQRLETRVALEMVQIREELGNEMENIMTKTLEAWAWRGGTLEEGGSSGRV